ncbi:NACHT domain-containing protein [Streptomyces anulatus]
MLVSRVAVSGIMPLIKKLFVTPGVGAGLTDKPVRLSGYVSFKGEKLTLTKRDLTKLSAQLVNRCLQSMPPHERIAENEKESVCETLACTLYALGDLDMDDAQAVKLGHEKLAEALGSENAHQIADLSTDATELHNLVLEVAALHILHFFSQASTFIPRTLIEQSRELERIARRVDSLDDQRNQNLPKDFAFEQKYLSYVTKKHCKLTIYGIDLEEAPGQWPIDTAYLTLHAESTEIQIEEAIELTQGANPVSSTQAHLPSDQVLAENACVMLRGVAGSGKTTLIQWLAVTAAAQDLNPSVEYLRDRIPFVLPLRSVIRKGKDLPLPDQFLPAVGCPLSGTQPAGWVDRVLSAQRALVMIDGIDEIPEAERQETKKWVSDLISSFPGNLWMATSRPSAVPDKWLQEDGFVELMLAPMGYSDVASFIHRWHKAARASDSFRDSLLGAVRAKQDLGRLATNPLMCGLICALHRDRHAFLPEGRKELYEAALSMLYRRDRERNMGEPDGIHLREEPRVQLLQKIAHWLIRNNRAEMDRSLAEQIISDALPSIASAAAQGDARQILRHLIMRSGLLREPSVGRVDFIHRTFQDYLGAKRAIEERDIGLLVSNAGSSQWEDVIRMAVAHARPSERAELISYIIADGDASSSASTRAHLHLLAMACLEHATELDPAVRNAVESRAAALFPPRSIEDVMALGEVGPIVLEFLPRDAKQAGVEAHYSAMIASSVGTDAAIPILAAHRHSRDINMRAQLVSAWHRFDTKRYAEEVISHLDPTELFFSVSSSQELQALQDLGGRSMIKVEGSLKPDQLLAHVSPSKIWQLWLTRGSFASDLRWLNAFNNLRVLHLSDKKIAVDVSSLRMPQLRTVHVNCQSVVGADILPRSVDLRVYAG